MFGYSVRSHACGQESALCSGAVAVACGNASSRPPTLPRCMQVWTPLQFARALVQAFPWTPDPLSIANCVADSALEPSAESFLAAPRAPPSSMFGGLTLSQVRCVPTVASPGRRQCRGAWACMRGPHA